jgi:hypothetical protein
VPDLPDCSPFSLPKNYFRREFSDLCNKLFVLASSASLNTTLIFWQLLIKKLADRLKANKVLVKT